ncbi:valine--tRNA ligase-like [Paramacrobiotus metropolitanus]|uniref:valine--tRNA ligase-like n=1 Tax=Paramacrobiotus metropolitanus TaxID=2943436 RepID=UPI00244648AE|nr:valine--tRNA ligase-like [Paramacrobiotus metropolitanus]
MNPDAGTVEVESTAKDANNAAGDAANKTEEELKKEAKKKEKQKQQAEKAAKFQAKQEKAKQQPVAPPKPKEEIKPKKEKTAVVYESQLPPGSKKDISGPMPDSYSPAYVEAAWYAWWEKEGFFKPEYVEKQYPDNKEKFVIVIPPPNVTGTLHLGHALTNAIEDTLSRWHRMCGKATLWVPGCDHAGIATQVVVEKRLWREQKVSRHELGREKFLEEVWKWKNEKGDFIYNQLRRMGSSVDWERARFTMEPVMSRAVIEAFIRLQEEGLIYRSRRLVNWSCTLKSCISDIEVEKRELTGRTFLSVPGYKDKVEFGVLISFAYPLENSDDFIVVSTTRIETMLGDTAIAVHPNDDRYKKFVGHFAKHPLLDRKIPIVADEYVDMTFGSGAVKITPAHDHNDYAIGERHNLDFVTIMDDDGVLNSNCGPYSGMKRFDVRKKVLEDLKAKNLYRSTVDNPMVVPVCSRSKDVVEPLIKSQWFVNCNDMAAEAVQAVRSKNLRLIPDMHEKIWFHWLENIRDWCISRQLWWGHRIPAYFVTVKGQPEADDSDSRYWVTGRTLEEAMEKAVKRFNVPSTEITLRQDEDVLDTWFSSGLFPFAVFAWPDETKDLEKYYPTSLLETGSDIIFFWVARMVMLGLKLTGKLPFSEVYLHSIIRDAHGRKMSKSLGNVIDPLDVIQGIPLEELHKQLLTSNLDPSEVEKAKAGQKQDFPEGIPECGTDALRFALCSFLTEGRDINLDVLRIQGYRFFCNKLWNALRFSMMQLGENFLPLNNCAEITKAANELDLWILSRAAFAIQECNAGFREYNFPRITTACYNFWLYELCDVYLECTKVVFAGSEESAKDTCRQVLYTALDVGLRLISPFMPFISEELYQRLPRRSQTAPPSICITPYPRPEDATHWGNKDLENRIDLMMQVVRAARSLRADYNLAKSKTPLFVLCQSADIQQILEPITLYTKTLTNSSDVTISSSDAAVPKGCGMLSVRHDCSVYLSLEGFIDVKKEMERLTDKQDKLFSMIERLKKATSIEGYLEKVPPEVRQQNAERLAQQEAEKQKLEETLATLKTLTLS